jgi:repressor LexA
MDMGQKIYNLRIEKGMTLEELGNKIGVGKSTVRKWENGIIANMKRDKIAKVAEALETTPAYLMGWQEEDKHSDYINISNIFPIELKKYPLLGEIACGEPIFCNEDRESYILSGTGIDADFCLRAHGDSMINARILDGDIVFIKKQDEVENGEIAAVIIDNEATLKRINYYPEQNMIILKPENSQYSDIILQNESLNQVRILGKAVAFQSDVK